MKKVYGLEFRGRMGEEKGKPNRRTGRRSQNVELYAFKDRYVRRVWLQECCDYARDLVRHDDLRNIFAGMTQDEYEDYLYKKQGELK